MIGIISVILSAGCDRPQRKPDQPAIIYAANHCGGSPLHWSPHGSEYGELMTHNKLAIGRAKLNWNGVALSAATLESYLHEMSRYSAPVNLQVIFDDRLDCRLVNRTRALVTDKLRCNFSGACVEYSESEYRAEASRHFVF